MKTKLNQSKLKLAIVSAMLVGSAGLSTVGHAATDTGTLAVTTTVGMACTISTVGALTFLSYDPTAEAANEASAAIVSSCTIGGSAKITLGEGTNKSISSSTAAIPVRRMAGSGIANAGTFLPYSLYQETGRTTVWGDTPETGKGFTATAGTDTSTVYGKIAKNETAGVGVFTDTVAVTLTY